jgi:catechol 2,3-dioxygenase-like lactoylglutathione lyase family enzyme
MKLDHVAIWAVDIELLRIFYETYFDARSNLKYENERQRFTSYFLTFPGGGRLELMNVPEVGGTPWRQDFGQERVGEGVDFHVHHPGASRRVTLVAPGL